MELEYFSLVTNGRLKKSITDKIREELYHFEGKNVKVFISEDNSSREQRQFKFIHRLFDVLGDELTSLTGDFYSPEKIKSMCKMKLKVEKTSKLNYEEQKRFINGIKNWAMDEFGIVLPEPQKNY